MRVEFDEVDTDDDSRVLHRGEPFTGEVVERGPGGAVVALTTYFNGMEDGPSAEWYPSGEPKSAGTVRYGTAVGVHQEWHRNGTLAVHHEFDDRGAQVLLRRWDESGNLVEERDFRR